MSTVKDVLTAKGGDVATVPIDATTMDAVCLMNKRRIGAVIVMDGEQIAGIFTERDVMNRIVFDGKDPSTTRVRDVMTAKVAFVVKNTSLEACRTIMTRHKLRHLPVIENSKLVGMISSGDILARELKDQEETIKFLHEYMQGPN
jgi:CBS domain-containing protein